jgi:hypothetical protein
MTRVQKQRRLSLVRFRQKRAEKTKKQKMREKRF